MLALMVSAAIARPAESTAAVRYVQRFIRASVHPPFRALPVLLADHELLQLPRYRPRQCFYEVHRRRATEVREVLPAERDDLLFRRVVPFAQDDERLRRLAPLLAR